MKQLQDMAQTKLILQRMISRGLVTIEQLDKPSPGWLSNTRVCPELFPNGYQGIAYRNPLRDQPPKTLGREPSTPVPDYDPEAEFPF
jgi:hypothetical protein